MPLRPHLVCAPWTLCLACCAPHSAPPAVTPHATLAATTPIIAAAAPQPTAEELAVDSVFAEQTGVDRPGCAVAVARDGNRLEDRARRIRSAVLEARHAVGAGEERLGSVSKQFTAVAVVLLAQQGKLSLDDDVHRYLPELPAYPQPVTLRQMLQHMSGLRPWDSIEEAAGWPRSTRVYTQASVLDIVARQRALNFAPGTAWSYTNSNYNLAAIVVARVSGVSFPEFTRQSIFVPLGMTHTRWRDDYTRVIPGKATPYSRGADHAWHLDVAPEDAIGNGGLVTTVADLLLWNENFVHPVVGGASLGATLETPGVLVGGGSTWYGMGLFVDHIGGVRGFSHDGKTAGYTSYLERLPDERLSVAILCNSGDAATFTLNRAVVKAFRPADAPVASPAASAPIVPDSNLGGLYRSESTGAPIAVTIDGATLRLGHASIDLESGPRTLTATSPTTFQTKSDQVLSVLAPTKGSEATRLRIPHAPSAPVDVVRVAPWKPDARALGALQGEYESEEADARFSLCVRDGALVMLQGLEHFLPLTPSYEDVLTGNDESWVISFRRAGGRVTGFDLGMERLWRLPFARTGPARCDRVMLQRDGTRRAGSQ